MSHYKNFLKYPTPDYILRSAYEVILAIEQTPQDVLKKACITKENVELLKQHYEEANKGFIEANQYNDLFNHALNTSKFILQVEEPHLFIANSMSVDSLTKSDLQKEIQYLLHAHELTSCIDGLEFKY